MKESHPTIRDVARLAGVSHQTVSRVIINILNVIPETRKIVESAIKRLDYRPSAIARSMARGKTRTLACIAPNLTDYTFASIIEGAEQEARNKGYFILSSSAADADSFADLIIELVGYRRIDGLIVINPYVDNRYEYIPDNFPTIFVGDDSNNKDIGWVALDDEAAGKLAVQHLLDLGHREILCIKGIETDACTQDRTKGYCKALEEAQIQFEERLIMTGDWTATSGYHDIKKALEEKIPFSAVFAQNDRMAIGAIRAIRDSGYQVPDDYSVIGFDDMPLASYFDPPLTTIHQDINRIGQEAALMLITKVDQPEQKIISHRVPVHLIKRKSTAPFIDRR
jgi:DNA-binding LacI/PurR family transcriptional regulator